MLSKLAITLILVLTTSLALVAGASAMFRERPPFPGATSISTRIETRYVGDPAALRALLPAVGGGDTRQSAARSNIKVPGLQR